MKPWSHAKNSTKKYGGKPEDYMSIHDQIDFSKCSHSTVKHRAVFHSALGIYIVERIFGTHITNSDGARVQVRDIAEDHVLEDLGKIPSLDDWLDHMEIAAWMGGPQRKHRFERVD